MSDTFRPANPGIVEAAIHCLGYFGFGAGWASIRMPEFMLAGARKACDVCPLHDACLEKHKARVRHFLPQIAHRWDTMPASQGHARQIAMMEQFGKVFQFGPYALICEANTEDGMRVASGGTPQDRGRATIVWPLKALE